jgi:hypothetical protein
MTDPIKLAIEALEDAAKGYSAMGWGSQRIDATLATLRAQPDHSELIAKLRKSCLTDCLEAADAQ